MDLILDEDKLSNLNNNNNIDTNGLPMVINNNPEKGVKDAGGKMQSAGKDNYESNNNHLAESSPVSVSPTISETIYEFGSHFENPSHVISEKVQNLASQIYNELQKIMNRYNDDEDAVGGLMPLIVNVLENLDLALIENQQLQVELELCKDDNEQLVQAFEKEKQNKKKIEQRLFEFEFSTEEEKQHFQQRIDSLANIVKMLELKAKNASDHSTRLEEKESEMKKEYNKIHERYTELLRSHCDLMERVKIMFGPDDALNSNNLASLSNLTGTLRTNLQRFSSNEDSSYQSDQFQALPSVSVSADVSEPMSMSMAAPTPMGDSLANSMPRNAWMETEMSYDDTTTIIEDVEELQRDKEKEKDARERDHSLSVTENFFGMEKEIENLITENNELLATKNALNIVKDDLIAKVDELQSDLAMCKNEIQQREAVQERLKSRISQMEDELKKSKDELEETKHKLASMKEDDEEGVPIAQRKRFTRVEMSRVLMERNSYKEKYFELQDALRWSELSRATKNDDKRSALWKFFSNFFNPSPVSASGNGVTRNQVGMSNSVPAIRYSANPTSTPALEAMRRRARAQQNGDLVLMMDSDLSSERARAMKNIKAHVTRSTSGDRIQAYGWSITGQSGSSSSSSSDPTRGVFKSASVPVPIYCRPLGGEDIGLKIWCATAVDLSGGEAGFPISEDCNATSLKNEKQNSDSDFLADLECEINEAIKEQDNNLKNDQHYSTFVWICSVSHSKSKVTIVNIRNNPGDVLDSFFIKTHLLCIASVPGAKTNDLLGSANVTIDDTCPELQMCSGKQNRFNSVVTITSDSASRSSPVESKVGTPNLNDTNNVNVSEIKPKLDKDDITPVSKMSTASSELVSESRPLPMPARSVTLEKLTEYVAYTQPPSPTNSLPDESTDNVKRAPSAASSLPVQPMSTRLPTMWLGGQNGVLYVHSGIAQWSHCIAAVHLSDSILQIVHYYGRVFIALANGQCCIFVRSEKTGEWDFDQYYVLDVGVYTAITSNQSNLASSVAPEQKSPAATNCQTALYSIRCLEISKDTVWMGYRNLILIVNTRTFKVIQSFIAHPRKETYVRQLASLGDGVWCSFRLDSTLRLYSAFKPYQHVQSIDIEPYVSKMVTPKSFNFVRITALRASNLRLWIGTSNGVILCLPCVRSESNELSQASSVVEQANKKVTTNPSTGSLALTTFMPLCDIATIQLSFHGHKDNVKFFVCTNNLILSGGEGYVDFRISDTEDGTSLSKGDRSHLIVWEIAS